MICVVVLVGQPCRNLVQLFSGHADAVVRHADPEGIVAASGRDDDVLRGFDAVRKRMLECIFD